MPTNDVVSQFGQGFSGGAGDWRSWAHGVSHLSPMYLMDYYGNGGDFWGARGGPPAAATGGKAGRTFEDMLREYYDELNSPLDMNDPEIQAILGTARSQSQANAAARGVNGAASVRAGEDSFLRAAAGMRNDRIGMAGNALGMGVQAEQRNRDRAYEDSWRRWEMSVRGGQGMGQTIGAGLGALAGSYFGAPGVGAQIGAGIGGGLGNFSSGGLRPPSGNYSGGY